MDGVFARVLASLPTPLVLALREPELDVATTLRDHPRMDALELQGLMKEEGYCSEQDRTSLVAPSGATLNVSLHSYILYNQKNGDGQEAATQEPSMRSW